MVFPFIVAVLPSLIWLLFFLQEDQHPEPNRLVLKVFGFGALSSILALFLERILLCSLGGGVGSCDVSQLEFAFLGYPLIIFPGISLIEEYTKYIAVEASVTRDPEFDEPLDAMLYMIISALGFAAVENILFLTPLFPVDVLSGVQSTAARFIGATLLHALASAWVGYFLALSMIYPLRFKSVLIGAGLLIGSSLHFLFNLFILKGMHVLVLAVLGVSAISILYLFQRLKQKRLSFLPHS